MGRVMSVVSMPMMLAPILGPTIGGLIVDNASWRWIFFVNVPVGVIAVIAGLRFLPHPQASASSRPLDFRGLVLMALGLPLFTYGLAEVGSTNSFTSLKVSCRCVAGLALVALFVLHALRIPNPLLNLRLYKRPTFWTASLATFFLGGALFGGMILLPLYWQHIRHESVLDAGILMAPQGLGMLLVMPAAGTPHRPSGWRAAGRNRGDRDHAGHDPVRADRAGTVDRLALHRDDGSRHGHWVFVHARDDRGLCRARPLRAARRLAAAERRPTGGRLAGNGASWPSSSSGRPRTPPA